MLLKEVIVLSLLWMVVILFIAGIAAGLLASIAGLASLVSYPVLLALGVPPVSANTTNTASLVFTGIGASMSSLKELKSSKKTMWSVAVYALVGCVLGSIILVYAPASTFEKVVPFLIFGAGVLMLYTQFKGENKDRESKPDTPLVRGLKLFAIFLVGIYIGYFGASAGMILLAILTVTINESFAVTNAIKNFTSFLANALSLLIYAFTTKIYWWMVVPMGIGMFIGGYVGPVVIRHVPVRPLRIVIAFAAFGLAGYLFYTAFY